jgi:hypothetical protein
MCLPGELWRAFNISNISPLAGDAQVPLASIGASLKINDIWPAQHCKRQLRGATSTARGRQLFQGAKFELMR